MIRRGHILPPFLPNAIRYFAHTPFLWPFHTVSNVLEAMKVPLLTVISHGFFSVKTATARWYWVAASVQKSQNFGAKGVYLRVRLVHYGCYWSFSNVFHKHEWNQIKIHSDMPCLLMVLQKRVFCCVCCVVDFVCSCVEGWASIFPLLPTTTITTSSLHLSISCLLISHFTRSLSSILPFFLRLLLLL